MNFEKLLGEQVFKNHNCNPFQSPSSLSMRVFFCISMLSIPCFCVLSGYFYVSLNLVAVPTAWILINFVTQLL